MTEAIQFNQDALEAARLRFARERFEALRSQTRQQAASPAGQQQAQLRQVPFVERTGITTALEAGLPVLGGALGTPGGPVPVILGGALGNAAGKGLSNIARDLENLIRYGDEPRATLANQTLSMLKAGTIDLAFGTALFGLGRLGSQILRFSGKLTGAQSPEVIKAIEDAQSSGINIGAIDLDKPFFNISSRVGGIMPIVGGPIREARERKAVEISRAFVRTLDEISPAIDLPRLGRNLTEAAKRTVKARRAVASAQYEEMYRQFDAAGNPAVIPTNLPRGEDGKALGIKDVADDLIGELKELPRQSIVQTEISPVLDLSGKPITRKIVKKGAAIGIPISSDESFIAALNKFQDLPDFVTPRELEALQKNLNRAARARSGNQMLANDYRIITDINAATWDALDAIPREAGMEPVLAQVRAAKRSWGDLKALEENAAAGILKRVDRNFFAAGFEKPGNVHIDEIADLYLSSQSTLRSPQFVENLEVLIGPKNRMALARTILHRAAMPREGLALVKGGPKEIVVFDANQMRNRLGLTDPEKLLGEGAMRRNRQTLDRLLKGTGVSSGSVDSFLKTADRIQSSPTGDPSVFLTRKIVLSGTPKALIPGGAAAGAAATGFIAKTKGLMSLGIFIMSGRAFSKLISTPHGLALLREGFKPNLTRQQAKLLAVRLGRALPGEQVDVREEEAQ